MSCELHNTRIYRWDCKVLFQQHSAITLNLLINDQYLTSLECTLDKCVCVCVCACACACVLNNIMTRGTEHVTAPPHPAGPGERSWSKRRSGSERRPRSCR